VAMKVINVRVVPGAKVNEVIEEGGWYKVRVARPAVDGKANRELINLLSEHFNVRRSRVKILKGEYSRQKTVKIEDEED